MDSAMDSAMESAMEGHERPARRTKTLPPNLWLGNDVMSDVPTAMPTKSTEEPSSPTPDPVSRTPSSSPWQSPSPSPRNSHPPPSPQEVQAFQKQIHNVPARGRCTSKTVKATLQLGPTPPLAFQYKHPAAKHAHLICADEWPRDSPHLHPPHLKIPWVCCAEVRHHSYHGGEFLGIVVLRSNILRLKQGETLQLECRIGLEDDVPPAVLCWLQSQVYLQTFFQNRLSFEIHDVRLNREIWDIITEHTWVEMHLQVFVKGDSSSNVQRVTLHRAPERGQDYVYQPEVFGGNLLVVGTEKAFQHVTWAVKSRLAPIGETIPSNLQNLGPMERDLVPGDVMLCRTTRTVLALNKEDVKELDGYYVVVMPYADRIGALPGMGQVLVMKLKPKEEGKGSLFRVSKTALHPDPTVDVATLYHPTVEVFQGEDRCKAEDWCKAKLSLHVVLGFVSDGTCSVICGEGDRAQEVRVHTGDVRIRAELPEELRASLSNADAQTLARTSAHSA